MTIRNSAVPILIALFLVGTTVGCQTAYYAAWEKLGKEKRHLLKDSVEDATDEQQKASEQFKDVLTRMKEMYGFDGGELEKVYNKIKSDYERCAGRADSVRERIDSVEQIAADLFSEWEKEIGAISNVRLREKSKRSLRETKSRYARLHTAMTKAEASMDPVLDRLNDYVLYLKHNLNAQAVGALKKEVEDIEIEVRSLVAEIDKSVQEAEAFVKTLE